MAIYTVEGPDGKRYKIEGPEGATAEQLGAVIASQSKQPEPKRSVGSKIRQQFGNVAAGAVRGAGSIGVTLMTPVDAAARAMGVQNSFIGRDDRRASMDGALEGIGADTDSIGYGVGKIGAEIAGTAGIGGTLAKGAAMLPGARALAPYIASGGMQAGNMGARMAGGAITGAASAGAVNPGEAGTGALVGGLLPPSIKLASVGMRSLGAAAGAPKTLIRPFTAKGQEDIVAEVLQKSATNKVKAAQAMKSAKSLVPGSVPTVAQVADDAGLAQLERTLLNNPEQAGPLQQRFADQRAARLGALSDVAGTDDYYEGIKEARKLFANEDYTKAMRQGFDPEAVEVMKPQIESLMRRPSMQQAQQYAKTLARERDVSLTDMGSIEGLDWTKKALDKQINSIKRGTPIGNLDLDSLVKTKSDLMATIEQIAPGYKEANDNFAAMSKQVNSMEVARDLKKRFEPALNRYGAGGKEMANEYAKALEASTTSVKRATGIDRPLSQVMQSNDIEKLTNIARDLARKSNAESLGKATGSPTAQNIASANMIDRLFSQLGVPQALADTGVARAVMAPYQALANLSGSSQNINERLAQALLNPDDAAMLLARPAAQGLLNPGAAALGPRRGLLELGYRSAPILSAQ